MQRMVILILSLAAITAGCSHEGKKADPPESPSAKVSPPKAQVEKGKVEAKKSMAGRLECVHQSDTRTIEARAKDKGCELAYTKAGKEGIVASSGNGMAYCEKAADKLRDKLKTAGYECK